MAVDALNLAAFDFVKKPFSGGALVERVLRALCFEAAQQSSAARGDQREARLTSLSEREREATLGMAAGKLNKGIADELHVSMRTVEVRRAGAYPAAGVRSGTEVATLRAGGATFNPAACALPANCPPAPAHPE